LNNVLTPILMAGPMLRVRATDPLDQRLLQTLEHSAERGAALVRQILAFAHGTTGEPRLMQLKHLARDIVEMIEETFPKSIKLEQHFPPETWPVRANPTQIHQVLLNLSVNARDAMPRGGMLRLRTTNRRIEPAEALAIPGARPGAFVTLDVTDTGTGIPPDVLTHIWEPFFTTKEAGKGTGLGLSTVRGIVESHQGFMEVETTPGEGTTFRVNLPAAEADAPSNATAAAPYLPRGSGELLLLVDDEAANRDVTHATLARFGYRVLAASSGTEAVSIFIPRSDEIRLLITDLHMPNLDGASLTRILQRIKPGLKVLAISGLSSAPHGETPEKPEQFATDYLPKPFKPEALLNKVHQLLRLRSEGPR
jgi:two-component system, cell cycle sensor histidine kinase and response regulator CckA